MPRSIEEQQNSLYPRNILFLLSYRHEQCTEIRQIKLRITHIISSLKYYGIIILLSLLMDAIL